MSPSNIVLGCGPGGPGFGVGGFVPGGPPVGCGPGGFVGFGGFAAPGGPPGCGPGPGAAAVRRRRLPPPM